MATKKIRVYELARELGVDNRVVVELSNELKIGVKSHSSSIDEPSADRVRRLVHTALHRFDERLCATVMQQLSLETRTRLDALLTVCDEHGEMPQVVYLCDTVGAADPLSPGH